MIQLRKTAIHAHGLYTVCAARHTQTANVSAAVRHTADISCTSELADTFDRINSETQKDRKALIAKLPSGFSRRASIHHKNEKLRWYSRCQKKAAGSLRRLLTAQQHTYWKE
jgi:hypothetical protein